METSEVKVFTKTQEPIEANVFEITGINISLDENKVFILWRRQLKTATPQEQPVNPTAPAVPDLISFKPVDNGVLTLPFKNFDIAVNPDKTIYQNILDICYPLLTEGGIFPEAE